MRLYNTLTEQMTEFQSGRSGQFRMFICGPTVQDNVHLGHAKTYLAFDVLARWLLKKGLKVFFLMNITDVDDKIFDRAKRENTPYMEIAERFYNEFLEDMDALNIATVSKFARVSKYVELSASLVKSMVDSGKAYTLNGNVYFDVSKADHFGKLSHQSEYQLKLKQIDAAPGKKNSVDFLLWRRVTDAKEGVWQSSLGAGRPGWHIEDSAIAFEELGGAYDLHGGATELVFPHHEAELAQDEAISGVVPFVSIWMHTGLLLKDGEKMSKSLGNVLTIRDALTKYSADAIRFHFLKRHYRDSFDLNLGALSDSSEEFEVISNVARAFPKDSVSGETKSEFEVEFERAMDDDLDTPKAMKVLLKVCSKLMEKDLSDKAGNELGVAFWNMVEVFGFRLF